MRKERLMNATQAIKTAAAQPKIFERVVNNLLWTSSSFLGAFRNLGFRSLENIQSRSKQMLRISMTRNG